MCLLTKKNIFLKRSNFLFKNRDQISPKIIIQFIRNVAKQTTVLLHEGQDLIIRVR